MAAQRPPFTANDIQSLYKKVCIGNISRIPNNYSDDLAAIVSSLLKINPNDRPSASSILSNKTVLSHFDSL
jgi:serine/threonine protein kinase